MIRNQLFKVKEPVPSLELHSLEYKDNEWTYCYAFETPIILKDSKRRKPLYLSGTLANKKLQQTSQKYKAS